jgi:Ca2+/Na+ antiporter
MLIKVKYQKLIIRLIKAVIGWGSLFLLFVIVYTYINISNWVSLAFLAFYVYYLWIIYKESLSYITEIRIDNDFIVFKYFHGDKGPKELIVSKDQLQVDWYDTIKGNITGARIILKKMENPIITQYLTGCWNR